jgi:hypothetical protein
VRTTGLPGCGPGRACRGALPGGRESKIVPLTWANIHCPEIVFGFRQAVYLRKHHVCPGQTRGCAYYGWCVMFVLRRPPGGGAGGPPGPPPKVARATRRVARTCAGASDWPPPRNGRCLPSVRVCRTATCGFTRSKITLWASSGKPAKCSTRLGTPRRFACHADRADLGLTACP